MMNILKTAVLIVLVPVAWAADLRPPAVPLVAHDPYFSIWSMADHLTDEPTKHWTGRVASLSCLIRVDGKTYRLSGRHPDAAPALPQTKLEVLPTHTKYQFEGAGLHVDLTFLTPALTSDLDVLSRPASYVSWQVRSLDAKQHEAAIYFDAGYEIAVNTPDEPVTWSRFKLANATVLRLGSQRQPVLQKSGDDVRIDWGYLYLLAGKSDGVSESATTRNVAMQHFVDTGEAPPSDDLESFQPYAQPTPVLVDVFSLGTVGSAPVNRHLTIAYDDEFSVTYLQRRLRPYWRRNGAGAAEMLQAALSDYESLEQRCERIDQQLMTDLRALGGEKYARLGALAYRQTLAAHKLAANVDGSPLYFSKENFSNGSVDTVDVTYPSSPFFLVFSPQLLAAQIGPILDYALLPRWRFPFAPHDLGRYPLADGQQYGGGEKTEEDQMPVEESGNMILMAAALQHFGGDAAFTRKYWPLLTKWAVYLKSEGLDPKNQLCTDDFAGHLAHNANLSIKAILALAAYGQMAEVIGDSPAAKQYGDVAREYASKWVQMADDGDHTKLAFDRPGTWSQKYNLIWDKLLGLNLFPDEVVRKELAYYTAHQNAYGVPLDNRAAYTKIDWLAWTASLYAAENGFEKMFVDPAYEFVDKSPSRVPLTDWYDTVTAKQSGFQARSVVGGIFIRMLTDPEVLRKYHSVR